jgi:sugar lactone lactonase YvrE
VSLDRRITSLAFDPVTGVLYGNTTVGFGAPADVLYSIDPTTGAATPIGGGIGFTNVYALGFDQSGALFGIADATDQLISISTGTGAGTLIGGTGLGFAFDMASRPEDNLMFVADSGTNSLYTIDTATGVTTAVGPYGSFTNVVGLAFSGPSSRPVPEPASLTLLTGGLSLLALRRRSRRQGR